jgi:hypothetical protein
VALSKPPTGQCEGIGWGCNLYGGDAALFDAILLVPIALAFVLMGNAAIALVGKAVRNRSHDSDALAEP